MNPLKPKNLEWHSPFFYLEHTIKVCRDGRDINILCIMMYCIRGMLKLLKLKISLVDHKDSEVR